MPRSLFFVFVSMGLAGRAQAAPLDAFLPADTEVVITVNVRQLLDSELARKAGLDKVRAGLRKATEVDDVLRDLGFDPFKDLERVTIASPGGSEQDKGLVIVRGKFDAAKFRAKAKDAAVTNAESLKIHKIADGAGGQQSLYEVSLPEQNLPLFVAVATENVVLISPGKSYVVDGLKKTSLKRQPELNNKDMQALLEKMDSKQSVSVAGLGAALAKGANVPDAVKESLDKLDAIGGGVTATDEVKLEIVLAAKTEEAAKDIEKIVSDGLNQALGLAALLASQKKELAPAVDVLKSIRSRAKGKLVTIKAEIGTDLFDKFFGKDK